ncbi:unnamed protein product [Vitrella brassicaformis CCMP3155]|uniref:Endonuclease/exonuclease/phosphatase domain-containing protein n=1 Tax=Vitrella brassicaformis (strain CCMP3155) TaxID=1169540 RepID=A0A0G4EDN5_VITBC|nr:unnamed protein product [Vitrella brassicaformis CCMP3155]|eukprot:CEL93499.1 unnamed protein product [Vitrella brassicaformis CCMP3155]
MTLLGLGIVFGGLVVAAWSWPWRQLALTWRSARDRRRLLRRLRALQRDVLLPRSAIVLNEPLDEQTPTTYRFSVLQFNTLADQYSQQDNNFVQCEPSVLEFSYRGSLLLAEITREQPDIVCLEEVDKFDFFTEHLKRLGYLGQFLPKRDERRMGTADGCAIFYKEDKFAEVRHKGFYFEDAAGGTKMSQGALALELQNTQIDKRLLVVVTHLKAKMGHEDVRLTQIQQLIKYLQAEWDLFDPSAFDETPLLTANSQPSQSASNPQAARSPPDSRPSEPPFPSNRPSGAGDEMTRGPRLPVIICGDFNSEPHDATPRWLEKHKGLGLVSVYGQESTWPHLTYSTWKIRPNAEVKRVIDYIWTSPSSLCLLKVLAAPPHDQVPPCRFPNERYPSDHVSLWAEFSFR